GRLEVVVADDAAGDAGRPRPGGALVEYEHVCARAEIACAELLREVVRGRQAVDAGADDEIPGACWEGHGGSSRSPFLSPVGQRYLQTYHTARGGHRPKRRGSNGSSQAGRSPAARRATAAPVAGASVTPSI